MPIDHDKLVHSIIDIYIQLNEDIADEVIQASIIKYLNQLADYQLNKGLKLYENKNEFLKTHSNKYLPDDKNSYIPTSSDTKQIAVSAQGFIAYGVLNTYNALSDGWTRLEDFDSLEAFDELRENIFSDRHLNLEHVADDEIPTFEEITNYLTTSRYYDEKLFTDRFDDVSIDKLADAAEYHFNIYAIRALAHAASYKDYMQTNENKEKIDSLTYQDYIQLTNGSSYKTDAAKALAQDALVYQLARDLDTRTLPDIY